MNLERLKTQLIQDEGIKYQVYLDSLGKPTFGIGHLLTKNDIEYHAYQNLPKGGILNISKERVNEVFKKDVEIACQECKKLFPTFDSMCDELQEILANMIFNLGPVTLAKFHTFLIAINTRNFRLAASSMRNSLWYKQVGKRAERLAVRMENLANIK